MNYLLYRRLRGPVFLVTFGLTAALHQWHVLSFERSWPLYLIVFGVLRLVEGAALTASGPVYAAPVSIGQGYGGSGYQPVAGVSPASESAAGIVPASGFTPGANAASAVIQTPALPEKES